MKKKPTRKRIEISISWENQVELREVFKKILGSMHKKKMKGKMFIGSSITEFSAIDFNDTCEDVREPRNIDFLDDGSIVYTYKSRMDEIQESEETEPDA